MLILLTLHISSYDLPGLNVWTACKPLSSCILEKDSGTIYGECAQILIYTLESQETLFYRNKEEFQCVHSDIVIYMKEPTCWQRMELLWSMLSLQTVVFAVPLCCCHRIIIYAKLMALNKITHVYKTDGTHICTNTEQNFFTLPTLPLTLIEKDQLRQFWLCQP